MLKSLRSLSRAKLHSAVALAVIGISLAGCPGGGGGFQGTPELDTPMYQFLSARNLSIEYALLAKEKLGETDQTKSRIDYLRLQAEANAWLEVVAMDIRNGTTPNIQWLEQLQVDGKKFWDGSKQIADNIDRRVLSGTAVAQSELTKKAFVPNPKELVDLYNTFQADSIKNATSRLYLRQAEQTMRDRLADEILLCGAWPRWEEIKSPGYTTPCTSLLPAKLPTPVPTADTSAK